MCLGVSWFQCGETNLHPASLATTATGIDSAMVLYSRLPVRETKNSLLHGTGEIAPSRPAGFAAPR